MALFHTKKEDGLEALLQLKKTQAVDNNEKLTNIYERLVNGRNAFAKVYELNVKAVSQISALNQEIKFYTEKLEELTEMFRQPRKRFMKPARSQAMWQK